MVSKRVHAHLSSLGASSLVPLGLGDEDGGRMTEQFKAWSSSVVNALSGGDPSSTAAPNAAATTGGGSGESREEEGCGGDEDEEDDTFDDELDEEDEEGGLSEVWDVRGVGSVRYSVRYEMW